jgi:hypothetical protein
MTRYCLVKAGTAVGYEVYWGHFVTTFRNPTSIFVWVRDGRGLFPAKWSAATPTLMYHNKENKLSINS